MPKSVFVVMPIGDQTYGDIAVTEAELRSRYDHLIREALLKASPNLEVMRADDVAAPGAITTDILTRIMHADLVVADVTYPNPNVFYELGLRHACRNGTIIIRERLGPRAPFDIAHLRHIDYDNTTPGLSTLANRLRSAIEHFDRNPDAPDSSFQEIAKLTEFKFPEYGSGDEEEQEPMTEALLAVMGNPELFDLMMRSGQGETVDQKEIFRLMGQNPRISGVVINALQKAGHLDLGLLGSPSIKQPPPRSRPRITGKRKKRR